MAYSRKNEAAEQLEDKHNVLHFTWYEASEVVETLLWQSGGVQTSHLSVSCFLYNRHVGLLRLPLANIVTQPTVRSHGGWIAPVPAETRHWLALTTLGTDLQCMTDGDTGAKTKACMCVATARACRHHKPASCYRGATEILVVRNKVH